MLITFSTHSVSGQAKEKQSVHKSDRLSTKCPDGVTVAALVLGTSDFGRESSSLSLGTNTRVAELL